MTATRPVSISAHALKAAADFCKTSPANDVFTAVHLIAADGMAHLIATDSYRLYHYEEEIARGISADLLIPAKALKALKVSKTTECAEIDGDGRVIAVFARRGGATRTMVDPEDNYSGTHLDVAKAEALIPSQGSMGNGGIPNVNPRFMESACKAFDRLGVHGMYPQIVHSGEMAPVLVAACWAGTGRKIRTGAHNSTTGAEYAETRCRLRVIIMPTRAEKWFTSLTQISYSDGPRVVERAVQDAEAAKPSCFSRWRPT